ncbi:MAG: hypothetical protein D3916_13895, partial [Candidatus Electrothrix sp. MAN1_4]|nr:hypothetical protein [Candidatus Electrothrix sp. MAN1_4]
EKLAERLVEPQEVIGIVEVNSRKVMVLGEVNNPGVFTLDAPMALTESLLRAGGTTADAELGNVLLIRKDGKGSKVDTHDLTNLLSTGDAGAHGSALKNGDIVYVPEQRIAGISRYFTHLGSILGAIVSLEQGIILWPPVKEILRGRSEETSVTIGTR